MSNTFDGVDFRKAFFVMRALDKLAVALQGGKPFLLHDGERDGTPDVWAVLTCDTRPEKFPEKALLDERAFVGLRLTLTWEEESGEYFHGATEESNTGAFLHPADEDGRMEIEMLGDPKWRSPFDHMANAMAGTDKLHRYADQLEHDISCIINNFDKEKKVLEGRQKETTK